MAKNGVVQRGDLKKKLVSFLASLSGIDAKL
jgi:hypothetical protein